MRFVKIHHGFVWSRLRLSLWQSRLGFTPSLLVGSVVSVFPVVIAFVVAEFAPLL